MKAVIYGAGSIGRGFIGELMLLSDIEIILIDVDETLLNKIKENNSYTLKLISPNNITEKTIPVKACINGNDKKAVISAVSKCDLIFTAVGVNALKYIAKTLADGLTKRAKSVNIILCENMMDAHLYMKSLLKEYMDNTDNVGFLRASVGRMVPIPVKGVDSLVVCAEPYYHLPIDGEVIVGDIPKFYGLEPTIPFDFAIEKKLFIHNLGHVASGWFGQREGLEYIWQCMLVEDISLKVRGAMHQAAVGLSCKYNYSIQELEEIIDDLIVRFGNKELNDTVTRVGRDSKRKLSHNDRVIGAINLCKEFNVDFDLIIDVVKAGLEFTSDDSATMDIQDMIKTHGVGYVLENVCDIVKDSIEYKSIVHNT